MAREGSCGEQQLGKNGVSLRATRFPGAGGGVEANPGASLLPHIIS